MLWKCCTHMSANSENSPVATGLEKVSFHSNIKKGQWQKMFKLHAIKIMLKILQARLQQCVNQELPDVQAGFRKGRGTRDQIANIHWIIEKAIWSPLPLPFPNPACTFGNFPVHELLKPSLKDFEHYLARMWNECNCAVVWTFFGIAFLWDWNEDWLFRVLWPLLTIRKRV